jgi:hypothetical protein
LPYGKITSLLRDRFGLRVTRGGLVHAMHRAARQAQPTYAALCATVRGSPVVTRRNELARRRGSAVALGLRHPGDDGLCHSAWARSRAGRARDRGR